MNNVKQVIVMRKDLGMRKGKMIAQGAHASMKVILDLMQVTTKNENIMAEPKPFLKKTTIRTLTTNTNGYMEEWLSGSFTKICVSVMSEEELELIYLKAKDAKLPCSLIIDSGFTEFHGEPTKTCCAIGPASSEEINKITGELHLL